MDDESRKESHSSASESRCSRPVTTALSCCCSAISRSGDGTGGGVFGIVDENVLLKFTDAKVRVYLCVCVWCWCCCWRRQKHCLIARKLEAAIIRSSPTERSSATELWKQRPPLSPLSLSLYAACVRVGSLGATSVAIVKCSAYKRPKKGKRRVAREWE